MPASTRPHPRQHPRAGLSDLLSAVRLTRGRWAYADLSGASGFAVPPDEGVCLHAVIHGSVRIALAGGEQANLATGDVVIVPSGEAHALRSASGGVAATHEGLRQETSEDVPKDYSFGDGSRVVARVLSGRLAASWPEGVTRASLPSLLRVDAEPILGAQALAKAGTGAGASALLTRLAETLLVAALRTHPQCRALLAPGTGDPVGEALALVSADPSADWTVESLARAVGMGRSSFAALFTRTAGRAPMEVVAEQRMERAAKLLREGRLKVAEIGELAGYGSEAAFSRRFTRHFGVTPSRMRELARAERAEEKPAPSFRSLLGGERRKTPTE